MDVPGAWQARGLPEDASAPLWQAFDPDDDHTPSYLTARELLEKRAELLVSGNQGLLASLSDFIRQAGFTEATDTQRVVFWFDN